ncbi:ABC transporter substrate-binding protein [Pseudomonas fontis]|uniref:ABC transporter substrate-binding protein n=1 Tax=Pseudomonas fontis TaxID=2942633 RepID=A0ABT5NTJ5_9PSED|nr:ABC transporter substrate-binding protein [Pseudomonas fontis]MDD0976877.1 ABC transporter substrate-binding protein [Pseudomonas fontis]MDD0991474.1 ABC transporter substrate-binding protein [Pseudomonas fontis]
MLTLAVFAVSLLASINGQASSYPVTVKSCNRSVVFTHPPARAVSQDVNLTEMMVALGLQSRMVGYSGVTGWNKPTAGLMTALKGLPEIATHYPTMETLLNVNADFFFAGWNYGMKVGGDVTPQTLEPFGIQVYELTESCSLLDSSAAASLEQVYTDLANLGKIFDVEDRAQLLITQLRKRQQAVTHRVAGKKRPRVFVYDSGEDRAFTAGRQAIPQALIDTAGGQNVMDKLNASWTQVGWESLVETDPQFIVIVDYGERSAAEKIQFLLGSPALQSVQAIRNKRFVVLPYSAMTPGIQNLDAIESLADAFDRGR